MNLECEWSKQTTLALPQATGSDLIEDIFEEAKPVQVVRIAGDTQRSVLHLTAQAPSFQLLKLMTWPGRAAVWLMQVTFANPSTR